MRAITLVACMCLSCAAVFAVDEVGEAGLTPVPQRPPAFDFDLPAPSGERVRLADYRGRPLIVNFWASWCPPCRAEMPSMQRAWERLQAEGIGIIAINVGDNAGAVQRFAEEYQVSFPLPMDLDSQVTQAWPVKGLPTTYVVDPQGRLAYQAEGEREWDRPELLDLVRALSADE